MTSKEALDILVGIAGYNAQFLDKEEIKEYNEALSHYEEIARDLEVLEDIEEELGIDLITLLYKHPYAKHLLYNLIHNIPFVFAPKKEEQGKTWALTKEETL